jgi:hypothetical protein
MEIHQHEHEPHKTGHHLFDLVISGCALLISAISIFMAYHTGQTMEKLVHANSWPFLELGSSNRLEGRKVVAFEIENAGIGPARIHDFDFLVDGKTVDKNNRSWSLSTMLEACCAKELAVDLAKVKGNWAAVRGDDFTSTILHTFLAPGKKAMPLAWPETEVNATLWEAFNQARFGRITMRVCYCSVFDECWIAEIGKFPPKPVDSCR